MALRTGPRAISHIRHEILEVRRALAPSRDAARRVLDDRVELDGDVTLFPRDVELHFTDAYDEVLRANDGLDLARDLLSGVRDYHQAKVAQDQNEVMKKLTVVASVLLLPTFIVGLYGQNLRLSFVQRLRDERTFPDVDALRAQIDADCRSARRLFVRISL